MVVVGLCGCASSGASEGDVEGRAAGALRDGKPEVARTLLVGKTERSGREEVLLGTAWERLGEPEPAVRAYSRAREIGDRSDRYRAAMRLGTIAFDRRDAYLARARFTEAETDAQTGLDRTRAQVGRARSELLAGNIASAEGLRRGMALEVEERGVLDRELARAAAKRRSKDPGRRPTGPMASKAGTAEAARRNASTGEGRSPLVPADPRAVPPRVTAPPGVIRRARWSARSVSKLGHPEPMNGVRRITLHHTATQKLPSSSFAANAALLRGLQADHQDTRGWADVGYHFIIDRTGRIFEGRELRYQGAHAGNAAANRHNVGIALVGNFDDQALTREQKTATRGLVRWFVARHRIPVARIRGHDDVLKEHTGGGTACPGRRLTAWLPELRRSVNR